MLNSGIHLGLVLQIEVLPGARFRYTFRAGSSARGSTWS